MGKKSTALPLIQSALGFAKVAQNDTLPCLTLRQSKFDATLHLRKRQDYLYGEPSLNISGS